MQAQNDTKYNLAHGFACKIGHFVDPNKLLFTACDNNLTDLRYNNSSSVSIFVRAKYRLCHR
jgi:hypothetical protein